jgi:hypothetical protein
MTTKYNMKRNEGKNQKIREGKNQLMEFQRKGMTYDAGMAG